MPRSSDTVRALVRRVSCWSSGHLRTARRDTVSRRGLGRVFRVAQDVEVAKDAGELTSSA